MGDHAPRARAVAGERAIHDSEHPAMDLLLDHQEVDQRFMDHRVRPVPVLVKQPAERVLHRARRGREHVRLHRGQVDDVLADEALRDHEALRVDLVQAEKLLREVADGVADVNPLFRLVDVHVPETVRLDDVQLFVFALAEMRIDHHGAVVAGVDQGRVVAVLLHRADHALELPRRRRAAGEEEVPRDIDLEPRVGVLPDDVLITGEIQQRVIVAQHGLGRRAEDRNPGFTHESDSSRK